MKKTLLALSLASITLPNTAWSIGESCNALLNLGLYNTTMSSSATDAQSLALSTFCSADYSKIDQSSTQALSISGSYGFGFISGGGGGSATSQNIITKQSQLCTSGFNSSSYSNRASDYSNTVYQGSLDAWNKCQELANQGLVFAVQPSSSMQGISVSITAPTGLSATYYGVTQFGSGVSECTTMANGKVFNAAAKPFKFNASSKVTVTCKRQMIANGADLSADKQDLVFVTSADNLTVPLAAIGSLARATVDQVIDIINSRTKPIPINCGNPNWVSSTTLTNQSVPSNDIYSCNINLPSEGVISLHLNGTIFGSSCAYNIYLDDKPLPGPPLTPAPIMYTTNNRYESAHLSLTNQISSGNHKVSVKTYTFNPTGSSTTCSLNASSITGLFVPN